MKKHHINRLEKLYAFLGTIKPNRFYFGEWAMTQEAAEEYGVHACGSTACALGWAGSMPEFRKRGLKMKINEGCDIGLVELEGKGLYSDAAGAEFFGLTASEAEYLFIPGYFGERRCMGPADMSLGQYRRGLRQFIDRKRKQLGYK